MTRRRRNAGFTLLELLVVMAILAFVSGVVILYAPPTQSGAQAEAERFAVRLSSGLDAAATTGELYRLEATPTGYSFSRFDGEAWTAAPGDRRLSPHRFSRNVAATLELGDPSLRNVDARSEPKEEEAPTYIVLDPVGMTTPAIARFHDGGDLWRVTLEPSGDIEVGRDAGA